MPMDTASLPCRRLRIASALLLLLAPAVAAAEPKTARTASALPLGRPSLQEERTERRVGEGLTYTRIRRGLASAEDGWTLRLLLPSREAEGGGIDPDAPVGMLGSRATAEAAAARVAALGLEAAVRRFDTAELPSDVRAHELGYAVDVGRAASAEALAESESRLRQQGLRARRWHTSFDGDETTGPWDVHVLTIDPRLWSVTSSPGESIVGRETVRAIAARAGATAAVNGGFFAMQPFDPATGRGDGEPGEAAGIAVIDGRLVSEATTGRPGLLLRDGGRRVVIDRFTTPLSVEGPGGERRAISGLNRVPGAIRNCGGGGAPAARAAHDVTCASPSEIVAFTPDGLSSLPQGPGVEVVLDASGKITAAGERMGAAPPRGAWALQATGDEAAWLGRVARIGRKLRITTEVRDSRGARVRLGRGDFAVNGGPMLVERGAVSIDADRDGLVRREPGADNFFFGWVRQRNPRTMAGVDARGRVLLVAVDGRQAGRSAGLSILEAAQVMRALGAVTAMNLDGGGSTTLVLEGQVMNHPSDPSGERADGDAVLVAPRRRAR
ncbi:MAG: phosphodiester glycosidase family protein [Vicinamibacteria bacterium]